MIKTTQGNPMSEREVGHTPGPWRAVNNGRYWQIDSDAHGQIGDACASEFIYNSGVQLPADEAEPIAAANARLMAAAPALLEAAEALGNEAADTIDSDGVHMISQATMKRALAAIAHARGLDGGGK